VDNKENTNDWSKREMGALWVKSKKTANEKYLTGHFVTDEMGIEKRTKVVIFSNRKGKEKNERAPDYIIYESVDENAAPKTEEKVEEKVEEQDLL